MRWFYLYRSTYVRLTLQNAGDIAGAPISAPTWAIQFSTSTNTAFQNGGELVGDWGKVEANGCQGIDVAQERWQDGTVRLYKIATGKQLGTGYTQLNAAGNFSLKNFHFYKWNKKLHFIVKLLMHRASRSSLAT